MRIRVSLIVMCVVGPLFPISAQVLPIDAGEGFFSREAVPAETAFTDCITPLNTDHTGGFEDLGCRVIASYTLGAGDSTWMVRYRRSVAFDYQTVVDSVEIDEFVLLEVEPDGRLSPLWHTLAIRDYARLERVESVQRTDGLLVKYVECLNGTGGCTEEFLFRGDEWSVVSQPFLDQLIGVMPQGFRLHKGRDLDIRTLAGVQPIAAPDDANCCPSGVIRFTVELRDAALYLVNATVGGDT